jgi:7-cyano-7-deazaguanine synthase
MKKPVCVLVSGGFDSCVLVGDLLRRGHAVYPLYVRCGFKWERAELHWLRKFLAAIESPRLKPVHVVDVPMGRELAGHWSLTGKRVPSASAAWTAVYLPGRNLVLLGRAAVFCLQRRVPSIAEAVLKGNPFKDATPAFRRALERAIAAGTGKRIELLAPYAKLTKAQVAARGKGLPLHLTFSCLRPRGLAECGSCSKCGEKRGLLL